MELKACYRLCHVGAKNVVPQNIGLLGLNKVGIKLHKPLVKFWFPFVELSRRVKCTTSRGQRNSQYFVDIPKLGLSNGLQKREAQQGCTNCKRPWKLYGQICTGLVTHTGFHIDLCTNFLSAKCQYLQIKLCKVQFSLWIVHLVHSSLFDISSREVLHFDMKWDCYCRPSLLMNWVSPPQKDVLFSQYFLQTLAHTAQHHSKLHNNFLCSNFFKHFAAWIAILIQAFVILFLGRPCTSLAWNPRVFPRFWKQVLFIAPLDLFLEKFNGF